MRSRQAPWNKKILEFFSLFWPWRFFIAFFGFFLFFAAPIFYFARAASVGDIKDGLQQDLGVIEQQISDYRNKISAAQSQQKSLKRDIQIIDDKAKETELQIQQTEIVLKQTQLGIDQKTTEIGDQEQRLDREKSLLGQYMQSIYEFDNESAVNLIFSQNKLSDIFSELNSLVAIQDKTYQTIAQVKAIKYNLEQEKADLSQRKDDELQLKALQTIQGFALKDQEGQKNNLLKQTKGEEAAYQAMLKKAKEDATAIKKQIYLLEGVGLAMTLEEAYKHAKYAADLAGIRPAFLMAVLKQESSWGTNVGTGFWKQDMKQQDQAAFVQICDELNLDPDKMPVSRKPSYGWGGAMGPAQFLPTTWLEYKNQVAQVTGHNPPSPWDIDDAFTVAALKLAAAGANQKIDDAEWKSAMIYFAGNNWGKKVYSFYGDSVMDLAGIIQGQLDLMNK